ncbi:Gfo/Idh/MocA family oxidoreductase [uncultured Legionella sp.]|uniref:Gfo/Idh/MocA family oxidoreductase n=1 Tax=uncultured Legionella sp. TaxID=210934 RepID=UPI00260AA70A|nr:Gfo/Idh/MocA family oxidoreductase [uncultured Legionella sp.]
MSAKTIGLIGSGGMAIDYFHVLKALNLNAVVIGRGKESALNFEAKTKQPVLLGGLDLFLKENENIPEECIVAVGADCLYEVTLSLLKAGVKRILVEKPGTLFLEELIHLGQCATVQNAEVYIGYNRRFYSSVLKAREIIQEDGGVTSFNFELTEWTDTIVKVIKNSLIKSRLFIANTTHVTDLAFHLGGKPHTLNSMVSGTLDWHPESAIFSGSGTTFDDTLFSYNGNWKSPGRWSLEIFTNKSRLIFRPMEKLQIQLHGSVQINDVPIDNNLDVEFKPGLYRQTEHFINNSCEHLCSIQEQIEMFPIYEKMAGYA